MITSSNGNIFRVTCHLCGAGNSPVPGEFPTQRPVTRSFDVFFDLRLNKRLSKQSWGWWLETISRPLWRHRNGTFENSLSKSYWGTVPVDGVIKCSHYVTSACSGVSPRSNPHYSNITWASWRLNSWQLDCLVSSLFRLTSKKISKHCIIGPIGS